MADHGGDKAPPSRNLKIRPGNADAVRNWLRQFHPKTKRRY
jgi:hypothetical protein